nr:dihydroxyacetone kinase, C-terminal domain [uncultured Gammaproteobacteria bacterium]
MDLKPCILPDLIEAASQAIEAHAEEVSALDRALGDGDHLTNLRRGLKALRDQREQLAQASDWGAALIQLGTTLMSTVGGASGSLYGTLFLSLGKALQGASLELEAFARAFSEAVEAVKRRGKTQVGEKTLVDTLQPTAEALLATAQSSASAPAIAAQVKAAAIRGMESTRELLASKGRASYLGERARGIVDAGARTAQLMICAVADALVSSPSAAPGCGRERPTAG